MSKRLFKDDGIQGTFDITSDYRSNSVEVRKFLDYYFREDEIIGKNILDAGCRTGDYTFVLLEKGAASVVGVDKSPGCIRVANDRAREWNSRCKFIQSDIRDLNELADSTFDIVLCVGTIIYLPLEQMEQGLGELYRVTKPGGTVLVLFQKEKGIWIRAATWIANALPFKIYIRCANMLAVIALPLLRLLGKRHLGIAMARYLLVGLRGIHFGIPRNVPEEYRVTTVTCEQCSESATASYKIRIRP